MQDPEKRTIHGEQNLSPCLIFSYLRKFTSFLLCWLEMAPLQQGSRAELLGERMHFLREGAHLSWLSAPLGLMVAPKAHPHGTEPGEATETGRQEKTQRERFEKPDGASRETGATGVMAPNRARGLCLLPSPSAQPKPPEALPTVRLSQRSLSKPAEPSLDAASLPCPIPPHQKPGLKPHGPLLSATIVSVEGTPGILGGGPHSHTISCPLQVPKTAWETKVREASAQFLRHREGS